MRSNLVKQINNVQASLASEIQHVKDKNSSALNAEIQKLSTTVSKLEESSKNHENSVTSLDEKFTKLYEHISAQIDRIADSSLVPCGGPAPAIEAPVPGNHTRDDEFSSMSISTTTNVS